MIWSKMRQQLEGFLCPDLVGRVVYNAAGYRYLPDKPGQCYMTVDKKQVFNVADKANNIRWYQTEQEIKNDPGLQVPISREELEAVRVGTGGKIPEERLIVIARNRKLSICAKEILAAQASLYKSDFQVIANTYLAEAIEKSLDSKDILLNVLALVDRRLGKKRLMNMAEIMKLKHPIVQYFYELRRSTM